MNYDTGYHFAVVLIDVCGKCLNFKNKKQTKQKQKYKSITMQKKKKHTKKQGFQRNIISYFFPSYFGLKNDPHMFLKGFLRFAWMSYFR